MLYIIDGHNYIHQISSLKKLHKRGFSALLKKLNDFRDYCHEDIIVVFDGPQFEEHFPHMSQGLEIIYSGRMKTADALIESLIKERQQSQEICVVTQDYAIQDFAREFGVFTLLPSTFEHDFENRVKLSKRELERRLRNR